MWNLEKNPGAIAGLRIASASPAMRQVQQYLNSLGDNFVAFLPSDVRHKSDTARVMFLSRMVQTLRGRRYIRVLSTRRHGHVSSIGTSGRLGRCRMSCS